MPRDGSADEWVEARFRIYGKEVYAQEYTKAVQGYPSRASQEKGRAILEAAIDEVVQLINDLRNGKLPITKVK
ncbi:hypothetical protein JCM16161A_12890 [Vulcanisaeta sp. JCM 16161]|uniref:hypothetical protein n=1 Tax=Vulcanisaeta sp. JCM 16161 TaxID=1295372 RepID=UPI0006D10F18